MAATVGAKSMMMMDWEPGTSCTRPMPAGLTIVDSAVRRVVRFSMLRIGTAQLM